METIGAFLNGILWLTGFGAVIILFARSMFRPQNSPAQHHYFYTSDGWRLAIGRYLSSEDLSIPPPAPTRDKRGFHHPVILCHGLAANELAFDIADSTSMARFLSAAGLDVWTLNLRGHGLSDKPQMFGQKKFDWSFDDYLTKDLPAAIDYVCNTTGAPAVHWLGMSMGGNLMLAYLTQGGEKVKSVTLCGSSLDYSTSDSWYHKLIPLIKGLEFLRSIPIGVTHQFLALLAGRFSNHMERFQYSVNNVVPEQARTLFAYGFESAPPMLLKQLASLFAAGGITSFNNRIRYSDGLGSIHTPILALSGDNDMQCPTSAVMRTIDAIPSSTPTKFIELGINGGQEHHYGHFDLVMGKNAKREVFPHILEWIETHD